MNRQDTERISPRKLLVVEDSATQAELLQRLLVNEGYLVTVAGNGREGLARTRELMPDLVLSDIVMPEMTGFELCRRIKSDPRMKGIPVILLTSLSDPGDVLKGLECGADNFITKPYDESYLLLRIKHMLLSRELLQPEKADLGTAILFEGERYLINSEPRQILNLLLSTYEAAVLKNQELLSLQRELYEFNEQLEKRVEARTESLQREVEERTRAEEALGEMTRRLQLATASASLGVWDWDVRDDRLIWDERTCDLYGVDERVTCIEGWKNLLHPEDRETASGAIEAALQGEGGCAFEHRVVRPDGALRHVKANGLVLRGAAGRAVRMIGVVQDISGQKALEEQLLQAQKMEAIGQFAGGIAHDFNNILTAIFGFASLVQLKLPEGDPLRLDIDQVIAAAERGAGLTQSLLAFSRKQVLNLRPVSLNDIISKVEKFVGRIIGEDIKLKIASRADNIVINADTGQIEQVLLNLATNARDAMPHGGVFSILTETVDIDKEYIDFYGYGVVGAYARMVVSDSGIGMAAETRERIFDPFFTTKEVGKGTGLGLSIVYGIIKQHKGFINVYSEPERGTVFNIYLPLAKDEQLLKVAQGALPYPAGGSETILIAEDDEVLRQLAKTILTEFGYTVIEAINGEDAVRKFMENREGIQLVLLDIVMPKKNGKEVYDEIRQTGSDVKILFLSGYPVEVIGGTGLLQEGVELITKPVHPQTLLRKIREELDGPLRQRPPEEG